MSPLTRQEIFDRVVAHLRQQGAKSLMDGTGCAYRGDGDMKCAAGVLIADEYYSTDLEWESVKHPPVAAALVASGVPTDAMGLVGDLQFVHDKTDVGLWEGEFAFVARAYSLNYAPPAGAP